MPLCSQPNVNNNNCFVFYSSVYNFCINNNNGLVIVSLIFVTEIFKSTASSHKVDWTFVISINVPTFVYVYYYSVISIFLFTCLPWSRCSLVGVCWLTKRKARIRVFMLVFADILISTLFCKQVNCFICVTFVYIFNAKRFIFFSFLITILNFSYESI